VKNVWYTRSRLMATLRASHGFIGATLIAIPFMSSLCARIGSYFSVHRRPSSNMTPFPKLTSITYAGYIENILKWTEYYIRTYAEHSNREMKNLQCLTQNCPKETKSLAPWNIVIQDKPTVGQLFKKSEFYGSRRFTNVRPSLSGPTLNQMKLVRASNSLSWPRHSSSG
jgi:hypothetical protein